MRNEINIIDSKKQVKREVSKASVGVLLYNLIMLFIVMGFAVAQIIGEIVRNSGNVEAINNEEIISKIMNSGTSSIVAVITGVVFLYLFFWRMKKSVILKSNKSMNAKSFFKFIVLLIGIQLVFSAVSYAAEGTLNAIGYTMEDDINSASAISSTISMFLYASIIGPVTEEIVFRGFVLRSLEKYGKFIAIIISSILFGAMHGNLVQGIFAVCVGILLGYIAMEYSIKWSIALHIINNLVFSDLLGYMLSDFSEGMQNYIFIGIEAVFFIMGLIIIIRNRSKINMYIKENKTNNFKAALTSVGFIIAVAIMFLEAISGISKL